MVFLHLRRVMSNRILTQVPLEIRPILFETEAVKEHFAKEIEIVSSEEEYRAKLRAVLESYFSNFDDGDVRQFLDVEVKSRGWGIFNYLFIRKAIDQALDKNGNEKEACSKLLTKCTQEFNFGNNDFGYAFD